MTGDVSKFGTDEWIPSLKSICYDFQKNLAKRPGGRFLYFKDEFIGTIPNPGIIVKEYHESINLLKDELYGSNAINSYTDHHKIAALYIRSFLKHQPFLLDIPAETNNKDKCLYTMLPNEYFSILYLNTIFRGANNDFDRILQIDKIYMFSFVKLLYRYKKDINKLDVAALSNIIYLIEEHYFKK